MRIVLASNNTHKRQDFRTILAPRGIEVLAPAELGLTLAVDETGRTFADNARLKADALRESTHLPAVADDSGLVVDALGGRPGIYSARYGGPEASDEDRNRLVLNELRDVPQADRTARFVATVALARPGRETVVFEGVVEGIILPQPRGHHGFGYDPIFYYPPLHRSFAELTHDEKAKVSHRGQALAKLVTYLADEARRSGKTNPGGAPVY